MITRQAVPGLLPVPGPVLFGARMYLARRRDTVL